MEKKIIQTLKPNTCFYQNHCYGFKDKLSFLFRVAKHQVICLVDFKNWSNKYEIKVTANTGQENVEENIIIL
jgi:hypothetical protein